jgi:hypothetical protein
MEASGPGLHWDTPHDGEQGARTAGHGRWECGLSKRGPKRITSAAAATKRRAMVFEVAPTCSPGAIFAVNSGVLCRAKSKGKRLRTK